MIVLFDFFNFMKIPEYQWVFLDNVCCALFSLGITIIVGLIIATIVIIIQKMKGEL